MTRQDGHPTAPEGAGRDAGACPLRRYALLVGARHGMAGMEREADRVAGKIEAALAESPSPGVRARLDGGIPARALAAAAVAEARRLRDGEPIVGALVSMQRRILTAQAAVDPHTRASLVLFTDRAHWAQARSYADHLDGLAPRG